jgi:uncharacterized membrane protein YhaH (DUF805 family)
MLVVLFIPWLMWGFAIHTERLHDRNKSAWWLLLFYVAPALMRYFATASWFAGTIAPALYSTLTLTSFALATWGFVEIGCLAGTAGSNRYGPDPQAQARRPSRSA